jgi:predicted transcriptional regulator
MTDKVSDKTFLKDKYKKELADKVSDKSKMTDKVSDIMSNIILMASSNDCIMTSMVASECSLDTRTARRYLTRLVDYGYLVPEGGNKNKKYRIAKQYGTV